MDQFSVASQSFDDRFKIDAQFVHWEVDVGPIGESIPYFDKLANHVWWFKGESHLLKDQFFRKLLFLHAIQEPLQLFFIGPKP